MFNNLLFSLLWIFKQIVYYPVNIITKIAWIIGVIILMYKHNDPGNFFLWYIIINSIMCMYRYTVKFCYYGLYRMCVFLNIFCYYSFLILFIFMRNYDEFQLCTFLWLYITLEYIVLTIVISRREIRIN